MEAFVNFLNDTTMDSSTLVNQFSTLPRALRPYHGRNRKCSMENMMSLYNILSEVVLALVLVTA